MKEYVSKILHQWKVLLQDRTYVISLLVGFLVLAISTVLTLFVSTYVDSVSSPPVGDLILNALPTFDLEFIFSGGLYVVIGLIIAYLLIAEPELTPFTLKSFGILFIVRCGFMVLTYIGPPEGFFYEGMNEREVLGGFMFRNDLFFSGHTSIPFLAFLVFKDKRFRWVMLISSIVMAITVLLMHVHYSIDVFSAFFITYGIYALADKIFNELNVRFKERLQQYGWHTIQYRMRQGVEKIRSMKDDLAVKLDTRKYNKS